ncbi:hypothetical protein ADK67_13000 [Saccharothrix sp. NRRL B-16348]|uniref:hypothetical protein n=1 Tax=Saccharothrix sp. NRRL B-16348 TaxID=1415542 RepID=UPI0006ADD336|nr:hypothetical protein [Saccharothrix sp. NRRL B-16348]KOX27996.1 hypothetical protein ADK67_13000 [Saccharothrix sp. NRRL B-16348]
MAAIPLVEGDLRWVFPDLVEVEAVLTVLRLAEARVERLAGRLGRPGAGLVFDHLPGAPYAGLSALAEFEEVAFHVHVSLPRDPHRNVLRPPPPWQVEGEISVRCDAIRDCGRHEIESVGSAHDTPLDAADGVLTVAGWLLDRGTAQPHASWRKRDVLSRHR